VLPVGDLLVGKRMPFPGQPPGRRHGHSSTPRDAVDTAMT
jgi:hypothetical protein